MANFQVTDKLLLTNVDRAADSILIYDADALALKRTTINYALDLTSHPVGINDVQTLTLKTLTSPTISSPTMSGTITGTYTIGGTPTFPSSVVTLTGIQTLTNKILTSPTINTPTITNPTLTVDTISEFTSANGVTIDGLNIKDSAITTANSVPNSALQTGIQTSKFSNPYKFSAYRNAAANAGNATFALLTFDTKVFDTGSNYSTATGMFTAPVAGFYQFNWQAGTSANTTRIIASLAKNSTTVEYHRGSDVTATAATMASTGSALIQLALNDTVNILTFSASGATALSVGTTIQNYFTGYLVSVT